MTPFLAELSMGNLDPVVVDMNPWQIFVDGSNVGIWMTSGSEAYEAGQTVYPAGVALAIGSNGSTWRKGIVFMHDGLTPAPTTGIMKAMQLPTKAEIQWTFDVTGARSGFIRSDATAANPGIVFKSGSFSVTDNAETVNLFAVNSVGLASVFGGVKLMNVPANAHDLTLGLDLYNGTVGINGYGSALNLNVPTGENFNFLIGGTPYGVIDATGINYFPIGATGAAAGTFTTLSSGAHTLNAGAGLHLTGTTAASASDVTKHIELWVGAGYGFGVTGGSINYVVPSSAIHTFVVNAATVGTLTSTGLNFCAVGATGASTGNFTQVAVSGTKVVGAQIAGWGTPTGPSRIASFPGASATLVQCSNAIAQIIADLKTHGMLGA